MGSDSIEILRLLRCARNEGGILSYGFWVKKTMMLISKLSRFIVTFLFLSLSFISLSLANEGGSHELVKSKLKLDIEFANNNLQSYEDRIVSLVDVAFVEYAKLFGGLPKKVNGEVYTELKIKVSDGFGGEADPEYIELSINKTELFGFYNWEMLLLHEMLHLWSAETFRYADDQEQWFNEGVTEYLTFRLAAKLGIIKKDNLLEIFSKPIGTYLSAKGIGKYSLREAASTDQLKREHYFLVYHGGFVAGMVLDHQIRSKSAGEFSLDDLMRELYRSYSRVNMYSMDSIVKSLNRVTRIDFNDFFETYIDGREIIPVGDYFDIGRLMFIRQFGNNPTTPNQKVLSKMLPAETDLW